MMRREPCAVLVLVAAITASACGARSLVKAGTGTNDGGGSGGGAGSSANSPTTQDASSGSSGAAEAGGGSSSGGSGGPMGPDAGRDSGQDSGIGAPDADASQPSDAGSDGLQTTDVGTGIVPQIPTTTEPCPVLATGNVTVLGQAVQLTVGTKQPDKKGPVFFYWHGTGSTSAEISMLGLGPIVDEITSEGGIVASFSTSTQMGMNTGTGVWSTGDFAMADEILACAVQQLNVDVTRIYTGGCGGGGLQAGAMLYERSNYLAAAMPSSGGTLTSGGTLITSLENPAHVPAIITTHGPEANTGLIIDFSGPTMSLNEDKDVVAKGGFAVDCSHDGGNCGAPPEDIAGQWQFCKDHPFGVNPEPYLGGLPSNLPAYCTIVR